MLLQRLLVPAIFLAAQAYAAPASNISHIGVEDVDEDLPFWKKAAVDGRKLWQEIHHRRHGTGSNVPLPVLAQSMYAWWGSSSSFKVNVEDIIGSILQARVDKATWVMDILSWFPPRFPELEPEEQPEFSFFRATTNVEQRFFVAEIIRPSLLPGLMHWSTAQVYWYMWQRALKKASPDVCDDDDLDHSRLRWFLWDLVDDPSTLALIHWAIGSDSGREGEWHWDAGDPDDPKLDDPFWAMLASPTCRPLMNMLRWHSQPMAHKNVAKIWVKIIPRGPIIYRYYMWAELAWPSFL